MSLLAQLTLGPEFPNWVQAEGIALFGGVCVLICPSIISPGNIHNTLLMKSQVPPVLGFTCFRVIIMSYVHLCSPHLNPVVFSPASFFLYCNLLLRGVSGEYYLATIALLSPCLQLLHPLIRVSSEGITLLLFTNVTLQPNSLPL